MNKEKTAIQILIEDIDSYVSKIPSNTVTGRSRRGLYGDIKRMAVEYLKKEQEQIEQAFDKGYERGDSLLFVDGEPDEGSEYYQTKYGEK